MMRFLLLFMLAACSRTVTLDRRVRPAFPATPIEKPVAPRPPPFIVSAPYSATLLWAIDGAAGVVGHDPSYKKWLAPEKEPAWLSGYKAARTASRHDPIVACSVDTAITEEALKCARANASAPEAAALEAAIAAIDGDMRQKWQVLSPVLQRLTRGLEALLAADVQAQLFEQLRRIVGKEPGQELGLRIVLVGKIEGATTLSFAGEDVLLIETNLAQEGSPPDVASLVTRIAEWSAKKATGTVAMEGALRGKGYEGVMLAASWPEVLGAGFGRGLTASIANPRFCYEAPFAERRMIDTLAHELYLEWRTGASFVVGASFADHLLQILRRTWPKEKWTLRDVLAGVQVVSDDQDAARAFLQALGAERQTPKAVVPPGPTLARPKTVSPLAPRVLLATEETLRVRSDLLGDFQVTAADVSARLRSANAAAYWADEPSGVPVILVVAKDRADLRRAAAELAGRPSVPATGWTSINFVMAQR